MATKEQFLTELIRECYHAPISIGSKNVINDKGTTQIRRVYKCGKCKVILIHFEYMGMVPYKGDAVPTFGLDFAGGIVFAKLLEFAKTSMLDPGPDYQSFWERFCAENGGINIDEVPTLPKRLLSPYVFANCLCAHLLKNYPAYIQVVAERGRRGWSHD